MENRVSETVIETVNSVFRNEIRNGERVRLRSRSNAFTTTPYINKDSKDAFLHDISTILSEGRLCHRTEKKESSEPLVMKDCVIVNFSLFDNIAFEPVMIRVNRNNGVSINIPKRSDTAYQIVIDAVLTYIQAVSVNPVYLKGALSRRGWELLSWVNSTLKSNYDLERYTSINDAAETIGFYKAIEGKKINDKVIESFLETLPVNNNFCGDHIEFCWSIIEKTGVQTALDLDLPHKELYFTEIVMGFICCDIKMLKSIVDSNRIPRKDLVRAIYGFYRNGDTGRVDKEIFDSVIIQNITEGGLKALLQYLFGGAPITKKLNVHYVPDPKEDDLTIRGYSPEFSTERLFAAYYC